MTVEQVIIDPVDQFPVGMRVLAVDDDPTCLRVLQSLLRRCQYQVTTTHQAISALKMLRENKDLFDLVISDVHMPDMDGFKLLELVGLEMDLPVIMLSGNGDPKLVMKGITHGACDYLLKPVRIEELKNIWQHVVRRKKKAPKNPNALEGKDKILDGQSESGGMGNAEQNSKNNKRRKDQEDDEGEERDEESDNDDPSSQKKPRVVWTVELHRKFVGAVNQLGVDKAVPKKILELMNVEKLTRENVASHLQKYRLYLKRISCVANQQANLAAALGSADPSYLQMGSLNIQNLNGFNNFAGSDQFQNPAFRPLPSSGMLGRLNSPAGMGIRSLPSPGGIQLGQQNIVNNVNKGPNRFHQQIMAPPGNYNGNNILQGMPLSLEQVPPANHAIDAGKELPVPIAVDNSTVFPISRSLQEAKLNTQLLGVTNEPLMLDNSPHKAQGGARGAMYGNHSVTNEPLMLENRPHQTQGGARGAMYGNHSVGNEPLMLDNRPHEAQGGAMYGNRSVGNEPLLLDNRPHQAQAGARGAMYGNQNSVTMPDLGRCSENWSNAVQPNSFDLSNCLPPPPPSNISPVAFQTGNLSGFSPLESKTVVQGQGNGIGSSSSYNNAWNSSYSSRNSALDGTIASFRQCLDQNTVNFPRSVTIGGAMGQQNYVDPIANQQRMQGRFIPNNLGSLEDLASAMVKQEVRQPSGDFCSNPGPYGTCS